MKITPKTHVLIDRREMTQLLQHLYHIFPLYWFALYEQKATPILNNSKYNGFNCSFITNCLVGILWLIKAHWNPELPMLSSWEFASRGFNALICLLKIIPLMPLWWATGTCSIATIHSDTMSFLISIICSDIPKGSVSATLPSSLWLMDGDDNNISSMKSSDGLRSRYQNTWK